MSTLTIDISP